MPRLIKHAKFQPMCSGNLQETRPLDGKCPKARVATTGMCGFYHHSSLDPQPRKPRIQTCALHCKNTLKIYIYIIILCIIYYILHIIFYIKYYIYIILYIIIYYILYITFPKIQLPGLRRRILRGPRR